MTPEKLFAELLGLGLQGRVSECAFHKDQGRVEHHIKHLRTMLYLVAGKLRLPAL